MSLFSDEPTAADYDRALANLARAWNTSVERLRKLQAIKDADILARHKMYRSACIVVAAVATGL